MGNLTDSLLLSSKFGGLDWIFIAIAVCAIVVIMVITTLNFGSQKKESSLKTNVEQENKEEESPNENEEKNEEKEEMNVEQTVQETKVALSENDDVDDDIIIKNEKDELNVKHTVKYDRSFSAKMCLTNQNILSLYDEIKNYILSYKDVKAKMNWKFESFNKLKENLIKLALKKNVICVYLALEENEVSLEEFNYYITTRECILNSPVKTIKNTPIYVKVKSKSDAKKAKKLIDQVMSKYELTLNEKYKNKVYAQNFQPDTVENLVERDLIKKYIDGISSKKLVDQTETVYVKEEVAKNDEPLQEEAKVEEPIEEVQETQTEEIEQAQEQTKQDEPVQEEVKEPAKEEPKEKPKKVAQKKETPKKEEPKKAEPKPKKEKKTEVVEEPANESKGVNAVEADKMMTDETAQSLVKKEVVKKVLSNNTSKYKINLDTLDQNFKDGDVITLQDLKDKKLIDKKADGYKVLARGTLRKSLTIKADGFSVQAIKMIEVMGGKAIILVDENE